MKERIIREYRQYENTYPRNITYHERYALYLLSKYKIPIGLRIKFHQERLLFKIRELSSDWIKKHKIINKTHHWNNHVKMWEKSQSAMLIKFSVFSIADFSTGVYLIKKKYKISLVLKKGLLYNSK